MSWQRTSVWPPPMTCGTRCGRRYAAPILSSCRSVCRSPGRRSSRLCATWSSARCSSWGRVSIPQQMRWYTCPPHRAHRLRGLSGMPHGETSPTAGGHTPPADTDTSGGIPRGYRPMCPSAVPQHGPHLPGTVRLRCHPGLPAHRQEAPPDAPGEAYGPRAQGG